MEFFRISKGSTSWGDYGSMLLHGMTGRLARNSEGLLQLERTGPFVPPISLPAPGDVIVTESMRRMLTGSGLTGFTSLPVCKARIVHYEWHLWNRAAANPMEYPVDGKPEGYVLDRPHCAETAAALGDLWELRIPKGVAEVRTRGSINVRGPSWTGLDFFRGDATRWAYVSMRARSWLEQHVTNFVDFVSVPETP